MDNEETPTKAEVVKSDSAETTDFRILGARRFLVIAVVAHLATFFLPLYEGDGIVGGVVLIISFLVLLIAAGNLSQAVGDSWLMTSFGVLLILLIPIIGLISLLVLLGRTNRKLKKIGGLATADQ